MNNKPVILIVTYVKYDFMVQPLIELLDAFWVDHPPVLVAGTGKHYSNAQTIPQPHNTSGGGWIQTYCAALDFIQKKGHDWFFLCLDDLHPISRCNARYLNEQALDDANRLEAGYLYLLSPGHFLPKEPCCDNSYYRITPERDYSLSLQFGLWNTAYAAAVSRAILCAGVTSIWDYERTGSRVSVAASRKNYVILEGYFCDNPDSILNKVPRNLHNWLSLSAYPLVRGGFLYKGRSQKHSRTIYRRCVGQFDSIQKMIRHTQSPWYMLDNFTKRIKQRLLRAW